MQRMTATEASRNFSTVLSRVASGEEIEVTRNGDAVAVIAPPRRAQWVPAERVAAMLRSLPPADEDFAEDVHRGLEMLTPPESPWPS